MRLQEFATRWPITMHIINKHAHCKWPTRSKLLEAHYCKSPVLHVFSNVMVLASLFVLFLYLIKASKPNQLFGYFGVFRQELRGDQAAIRRHVSGHCDRRHAHVGAHLEADFGGRLPRHLFDLSSWSERSSKEPLESE